MHGSLKDKLVIDVEIGTRQKANSKQAHSDRATDAHTIYSSMPRARMFGNYLKAA